MGHERAIVSGVAWMRRSGAGESEEGRRGEDGIGIAGRADGRNERWTLKRT